MISKMLKTYFLITITVLVFTSCGDKKNKDSDTSTLAKTKNETVIEDKNTTVVYKLKDDFDSFKQGIDFSSLCITDNSIYNIVVIYLLNTVKNV